MHNSHMELSLLSVFPSLQLKPSLLFPKFSVLFHEVSAILSIQRLFSLICRVLNNKKHVPNEMRADETVRESVDPSFF